MLTMLVLGEEEPGMAKSTLINAIVNYLKHPTFDEAIQADEIEWVIPTTFCAEEYDEDVYFVERDVRLGEESSAERFEHGKLQTKWPNAYIISLKDGHKIRLIVPPGIGDGTGGGINESNNNNNLLKTLNFIRTLPELHAICILLSPNRTRTGPAFNYFVNGLFTHLHKNAAKNIVFLGTNGGRRGYKMGKTWELLQGILNSVEAAHNVSISLHRDNIYCLDNEAFEHLCLIKKANVRYSEESMDDFSKGWSRAEQELQRMLMNVSALKPYRTSDGGSSTIMQRFAEQLPVLTGPNTSSSTLATTAAVGTNSTSIVPSTSTQSAAQNVSSILTSQQQKITLATTPTGVGTTSTSVVPSTSMLQSAAVDDIPPAQTSDDDVDDLLLPANRLATFVPGKIAKVEPVCSAQNAMNFCRTHDASRLHHTNVKHLKLCLYMCPVCNKEFTFTINGVGMCIRHVKKKHRKVHYQLQ
uniref:G domain-containing protein n=1 Tax=Globodera rostochiensis TaxID=31243 RepID=A0A914HN93_GLORO